MLTPRKLQEAYAAGENISRLLRGLEGLDYNSDSVIEVMYDLQAGSYLERMTTDAEFAERKHAYNRRVGDLIAELGDHRSILKAGVGEATTLYGVLDRLSDDIVCHGFDISWSRVVHARKLLAHFGCDGVEFAVANMKCVPFADDSFDVVYTSHAVEPNGGSEREVLAELVRVARRFLVLLEPAYEFASEDAQARMDANGYCRGLADVGAALGCRVVRHELFEPVMNPLNPTALLVLEKSGQADAAGAPELVCPKYRCPLEEREGFLFSEEGLCVYPKLAGVPCLRPEHAVFASAFPGIVGAGPDASGA